MLDLKKANKQKTKPWMLLSVNMILLIYFMCKNQYVNLLELNISNAG